MKPAREHGAGFVKSVMIAGVAVAAVAFMPLRAVAGFEEGVTAIGNLPSATGETECLLSQQLKDVYIRMEYEAVISGSNTRKRGGSFETAIANAQEYSDVSFGGGNSLDSMSMECLSCHDGATAARIGVRIKESQEDRNFVSDALNGDHPVGMLYEANYSGNRQFRDWESLPADMVFMNGRVGCLTCHNLLNNRRNHLVMDNSGSALCLACHNK
jgi:predicted CXXCH cytochrome family protein